MMNRSAVAAFAVLGAAFTSTAVLAQTAAPASPVTANVALTTNYKFRGQDQDQIGANGYYKKKALKPAIQGGFDFAHESGFYVGNWNSSVNWLSGNSIESDLYGGYKFKAGPVDLDVGAITYIYPGNTLGNTTELYAGVSWADDAIGAFTLKYSHTVSKDYFGYAGEKNGSGLKGRNTGYVNLAYSKVVVPNLTLKAAVGYTRMSSDIRSLGYKSYVDYNVGATYDFGGGLTLSGSVQGANKKDSYLLTTADGFDVFGDGSFFAGAGSQSVNKARFIVTLAKSF
ncbi:MAG: hypothetical protein EOO29_06465 [Comamonadaceae bacterium]|nr:MAG: hypothetical protein EOO29_06465 [Comamonadaceae bacterium]